MNTVSIIIIVLVALVLLFEICLCCLYRRWLKTCEDLVSELAGFNLRYSQIIREMQTYEEQLRVVAQKFSADRNTEPNHSIH